MKMSPELRALKFYRKNTDHYLEIMKHFWGNDEKQLEMYDEIAKKFDTTGKRLMEVNHISYTRAIERSFR